MDEVLKSLRNLKRVRRNVQKEFGSLEDSFLKQFLGEFNTPRVRQDLRKFGDGHFFYSLPRGIRQLQAIDGVVVFAMTSPKLGWDSNFDPTIPLHTIPYWRDLRKITPQAKSKDSGRVYRLHYMAWQQNFHIHGVSDSHARKNLRMLLSHRPVLMDLLQKSEEASVMLVTSIRDWLQSEGKPMVVITNSAKKSFSVPISSLLGDTNVIHIEANLRNPNVKVMGKIEERLP